MGIMKTDSFQVEHYVYYLLDTAFLAVYHEKEGHIY